MKSTFKPYKYLVQHTIINKNTERFTVLARNKTIVFASNRPLFESIGLEDRKPDYKLIKGELNTICIREKLIEALDKVVHT